VREGQKLLMGYLTGRTDTEEDGEEEEDVDFFDVWG
jgi:hypothetical protein